MKALKRLTRLFLLSFDEPQSVALQLLSKEEELETLRTWVGRHLNVSQVNANARLRVVEPQLAMMCEASRANNTMLRQKKREVESLKKELTEAYTRANAAEVEVEELRARVKKTRSRSFKKSLRIISLCAETKRLREEYLGMECLYCGIVIEKDKDVTEIDDDVLRAHVLECPTHPLAEMTAKYNNLREAVDAAGHTVLPRSVTEGELLSVVNQAAGTICESDWMLRAERIAKAVYTRVYGVAP